MNIDIVIRRTNEYGMILCFTHAIQEAMRGRKIKEEIVDGNKSTLCHICYPFLSDNDE